MEPNEKRRQDDEPGSGATGDTPGSDDRLDGLRRAGEDFLAAGDAAIRKALSGDSERFLRQVRQTGGQ